RSVNIDQDARRVDGHLHDPIRISTNNDISPLGCTKGKDFFKNHRSKKRGMTAPTFEHGHDNAIWRCVRHQQVNGFGIDQRMVYQEKQRATRSWRQRPNARLYGGDHALFVVRIENDSGGGRDARFDFGAMMSDNDDGMFNR